MRTCTPEGRSMVNPGQRNEVTTPGVSGIISLCTPEGRSGGRIRALMTLLFYTPCNVVLRLGGIAVASSVITNKNIETRKTPLVFCSAQKIS